MRTLKLITAFILACAISLAQNTKEDAIARVDSFRNTILAPKLKQYDQRAERLTELIAQSNDKRCTKNFANRLANLSEEFMNEIASVYECYAPVPHSNFYVGTGFNPWYYPPGAFAYDPFYRGYYGTAVYGPTIGYYIPASGRRYSNDCMPPIFSDVAAIRRYANNMSMFTGPNNVSRKLNYINQRLYILKQHEPQSEGREAEPVSVR